jgi:capsular polysaccharide biosynthesis protein
VELSVEELHPDQVVLLTHTAVLVGIHGAALTNMLWMRPHRGAVVELGAGGNFHYVNMAAELGHKHLRLDGGPDVGALTDAVRQAMDHVSSRY